MKLVQPVLEEIAMRTPGAFVEKKETSLVFNYRGCDPDYGSWQANELKIHLEHTFSNLPLDVVNGKRVI